MTLHLFLGAALWLAAGAAAAPAEAKVEKLTFGSGGINRTYYLFVPEKARTGQAPLLLLLHGSGRNGMTQIDPWMPLARSEGIVLVAPDASDPQAWRIPQEGPDFFHDLAELVRLTHDFVDERRMYVFGHSAGAIHGLGLALLESEYFAAVAVHAGVLAPEMTPLIGQAPRKIPIAMWVGTDDALFPLPKVRATRDALNAAGFDVKLTEIYRHTHNYYGRAADINKQVWTFLQAHHLTAEPKYQQYRLIR